MVMISEHVENKYLKKIKKITEILPTKTA